MHDSPKESANLAKYSVELLEASLNADYTEVRRIGNALAKFLEHCGQIEEAKKIRSTLRRKSVPLRASGQVESLPFDLKSRIPLIEEVPPPDTPIFLSDEANEIFHRFVEEIQHSAELSQKGLALRPSLILSGPPGTGKTLFASHVAAQLNRHLYLLRLDSVISSFLGETAKNIRAVFEFMTNQKAVLLLDEIDAIAKMRDDRHELGELKRVVNTLIQGLDSLDEHSVVLGATNHPQLLDNAIWRRFPYRVELGLPDENMRTTLWGHFLFQNANSMESKILSLISGDLSGADIKEIAASGLRKSLLRKTNLDICSIIFSIISFKSGQFCGSPKAGLSSEQKKSLSVTLSIQYHIKQADIARLLNVSRQAVAQYLKGISHD